MRVDFKIRDSSLRDVCLQNIFTLTAVDTGQAVPQLVEALYYKPEGRGFDSPWCHLNPSLT
jgi:hypothetical protein